MEEGGKRELATASIEPSLKACLDAFDELFNLEPLARRALDLSIQLGHPAYDCFYMALTEQVGGTLVTADTRLISKLQQGGWAGQFQSL